VIWRLLLPDPQRIEANLVKLHAAGRIDAVPTLFQVWLGALYMRYRLLFRSDTIGLETEHPVRDTWRARALRWRSIRLPFLAWERAIAPLDLTGLPKDPAFLVRHVLGAHHTRDDAIYDLALLSCHPGELERLRARVVEVLDGRTPRARWLADLCVFEGYHANLLAMVDRALAGDFEPVHPADIPSDGSLRGFVAWMTAQPTSPAALLRAWRAGTFRLDPRLPVDADRRPDAVRAVDVGDVRHVDRHVERPGFRRPPRRDHLVEVLPVGIQRHHVDAGADLQPLVDLEAHQPVEGRDEQALVDARHAEVLDHDHVQP
jgi:hypothetical protein